MFAHPSRGVAWLFSFLHVAFSARLTALFFCLHNAPMATQLDPIISEFDTQEQADAYDAWFRAKVQEAIDSKKPRIPHDQVMAEMWEIIESKLQKKVA